MLVTAFLDHAARHHAHQTVLTANLDRLRRLDHINAMRIRSKALMLAAVDLGLVRSFFLPAHNMLVHDAHDAT
jgi:hypothetical protein